MLDFNKIKITLLYGLFNEYVFSEAKSNVEYLKEYFYNDFLSKDNTLIKKLIYIIERYKFTDITEATFISSFEEDGKSADEINSIIQKIKEYKLYTKEQSLIFKKDLERLCYKAFADKAKKLYGDDIVKYVEALKKFEYKSNYSDKLVVKNFSQLDITDLISRRSSAGGYKSRYQFINDSYTCGGYIPGQIVQVVGAPSTGKSLFLQGEAVNFIQQGKRVHLLYLGDLFEDDVAIRMTCMMSKKSKREVESDINTYIEMYRYKFEELLGVTVVPSGYVKAVEYVDWMLKYEVDNFDILMVDYDSNFERDGNLSMYDQYGDVYDKFTQLTRKGKLLFVASQPKVSYYNEEFLPMDSAGLFN